EAATSLSPLPSGHEGLASSERTTFHTTKPSRSHEHHEIVTLASLMRRAIEIDPGVAGSAGSGLSVGSVFGVSAGSVGSSAAGVSVGPGTGLWGRVSFSAGSG